MSSRAKIRGLTGWANFRLQPTTKFISNILSEILTGTFFKTIVENMTGQEAKKLSSMDNLSAAQREMRIQWIVEELKAQRVLANDAILDVKCCAIPSPDHIFDLLWRLVTYDLMFIWERYDYLMVEQDEVLVKYKLNWVPEAAIRAQRKVKKKVNFMAGLGGTSEKIEVIEQPTTNEGPSSSEPFPSSIEMKAFKRIRVKEIPPPKKIIFEIVSAIMKATGSDQDDLTDLVQIADVRVLVSLVNYFFGTIFTADVLLNDRWSMNLILRTVEKLLRLETTAMRAEDLAESDKVATCSYLCALLMLGFQYRQAAAVIRSEAFLKDQMKSMQRQLGELKVSGKSTEYFKKYTEYEKATEAIQKELDRLASTFDIATFKVWKKRNDRIKEDVYKEIVEAMERKFDIIKIPKTMTLNSFCISYVINLFLTNGVAFLLVENKQSVPRSTKLVLRKKSNGKFYDNISGNEGSSRKLYKMLNVKPKDEVICLSPENYIETMEVYMEFSGGNRRLMEGVSFLYQIFPSDFTMYIQQLINAARNGRHASVQTLLDFFSPNWPTFVDEQDPKTGETALHAAASVGLADMVELLLENYAKINVTNRHQETPMHIAMENFHQLTAQTLAEWGCDLFATDMRGNSPLGVCKNGTLVNHVVDWSQYCRNTSERIAGEHDVGYLFQVIDLHTTGARPFVNLRSRIIAGSTLLHAAAFLGSAEAVKELLEDKVDPNVTDYKGATPLHCTTDFGIAKSLLLAGANVNAVDREGNTPLHLRAFGGMVVSAKNKNRPPKSQGKKKSPKKTEQKGEKKAEEEDVEDKDDAEETKVGEEEGEEGKEEQSPNPEQAADEEAHSSTGQQVQNAEGETGHEHEASLEATREEAFNEKLLYLLFDFSADFTIHNKKGLMPIHCAAIRGRQDIIEFLLQDSIDPTKQQQTLLLEEHEGETKSPSLTYLALAYGHITCANWLSEKAGYKLKEGEGDELLQKLLTQKMQLPELDATIKFILESGADPNPLYTDGNSALHYAALLRDTINPIRLLVNFGSDVNRRNSSGSTPLMFACKSNNIFAACELMNAGADPTISNTENLGPFDVVPDLDEWISSGLFDKQTIQSFEKHILKQGQLIVHAISSRIDQHKDNKTKGVRHAGGKNEKRKHAKEIIPANHYMTLSS